MKKEGQGVKDRPRTRTGEGWPQK